MKPFTILIKLILALSLVVFIFEIQEMEQKTETLLMIHKIACCAFIVIAIDFLTMKRRLRRKIIKKGVCVSARIQKIVYPFAIYKTEKFSVSIGAAGMTANLNMIYAAYEFDGKSYVGNTGYQMIYPTCRVNDEVTVYLDPKKPERFYIG